MPLSRAGSAGASAAAAAADCAPRA